ncbi:MAG TPA: histidine kinase [Burkholderiaceae bacterium]|nr:histidine kinase [Burkholderiaceae bacterium]
MFGAATAWPACLLLFWDEEARSDQQRSRHVWLIAAAGVVAVILIAGLALSAFYFPRRLDALRWMVGYNALAFLTGGIIVLRPRLSSLADRVALTLVLLGPVLSLAAHALRQSPIVPGGWNVAVEVATKQSLVLTMLGALMYLGRFQASDRFAKLGVRVVLAWTLGLTAIWMARHTFWAGFELHTPSDAVATAALCAVVAGATLLLGWLGNAADRWVDRRVFGRSDPQVALIELRETLAREETQASIFGAAEAFLEKLLRIEARITAPAGIDTTSQSRFPVPVGEAEPFVLAVGDRTQPRLLVSAETDLVRQVAHLVGGRLEALEREQERVQRTQREARLLRQLVEAELRALRAQVNPHFLFNSLNTIAAMVHQEPAVAEAMTLRLARIFRHVLTQSERLFVPLREEVDFLRAYLDIEQIRFGDRLRVEFHIAEQLAEVPIPSLILQPLVENAIKHGFSPKVGECRLVIEGSIADDEIVLTVEDNGIGAGDGADARADGIGLRNVRDRLATVYGGAARLSFQSTSRQGCRATVYLPLQTASA